MKSKINKSLRRRIEQSADAISISIIREHAEKLHKSGKNVLSFTTACLVQLFKRFALLVVGLFLLFCVCCFMTSCNVTRTITNESQYYQRGDTSVVIQTKTIETYDASKKL